MINISSSRVLNMTPQMLRPSTARHLVPHHCSPPSTTMKATGYSVESLLRCFQEDNRTLDPLFASQDTEVDMQDPDHLSALISAKSKILVSVIFKLECIQSRCNGIAAGAKYRILESELHVRVYQGRQYKKRSSSPLLFFLARMRSKA